MAFDQVAQAFCNHYYGNFINRQARAALAGLYREDSMLTFQQDRFQGTQAIMTKLAGDRENGGLAFETIKHVPASLDAHPTVGNGVLVQVTGHVVVDGEENQPLPFAQTFVLMPIQGQAGGYFIMSDIFRLIVHV